MSLLLLGGTTTITGGVFQGGNGGNGGSGDGSVGDSGRGGNALLVVNPGTVANLYGGSYAAGSGGVFAPNSGPIVLAAVSGGTINIFADPGTFALVGGIATGSFGGTPFSYRTSRTNGGIIQGATAVVVPEVGTVALALPALGMIAFCNRVGAIVIRRRKK